MAMMKDALSDVGPLGCVYTRSRELFSRHFSKEVPTGRVIVDMASLYLESRRGVRAQWKPLQRSVEVTIEHAPLIRTLNRDEPGPL